MKVGFDATPLVRPFPRGVARVARGLCDALERRGRIEVVRLAPPPGARLSAWRARALPAAVRERGLAGVHSFTSAFARGGPGRRVQTVHELPWLAGVRENADLAHRAWARLGPGLADATACPTEHVAAALRRYAWIGRGRVRAIPWGVDAAFGPAPPRGVVDEALLGRYRLGEGAFALALGAVRPKKGLARVLHGVAALRARGGPELVVVVTGDDTPELRRVLGLAAKLGLARAVQWIGAIDEDDLPGMLRLASVVPVLSRSEGFGLPALEALASGTPVVVPRGSAQAEVAGDAGFAVDPDDAEDVARALERAIAEREELRFELPRRAAEFTWDACAERVEALWEALA